MRLTPVNRMTISIIVGAISALILGWWYFAGPRLNAYEPVAEPGSTSKVVPVTRPKLKASSLSASAPKDSTPCTEGSFNAPKEAVTRGAARDELSNDQSGPADLRAAVSKTDEEREPTESLQPLPFPISDSVRVSCKKYPDACKTEHVLLKNAERAAGCNLGTAHGKGSERIRSRASRGSAGTRV